MLAKTQRTFIRLVVGLVVVSALMLSFVAMSPGASAHGWYKDHKYHNRYHDDCNYDHKYYRHHWYGGYYRCGAIGFYAGC
jgi:hypothetical protein